MTRTYKELWYWTSGLMLLFVLMFILTSLSGYFFQIMAILAVAGCGILFYFIGIRRSFHILLLSLPLSLNVPVTGSNQLMFPSELLVVAFGLGVLLYWIKNTNEFLEWLQQPVTIALLCYLFFMLVSVFFSELIVVSVKSAIIKFIYVTSFYGGGYLYFKSVKHESGFVDYYLVPLCLVVMFVLFRHLQFSFSNDVAGYVTKPFFQDHTIYSAALSFILPLALIRAIQTSGFTKTVFGFVSALLIIGLILASSRASWLSSIISFIIGLLVILRFPRILLALVFIGGLFFVTFNSSELIWKLKANRFDSNARNAGIEAQTKSVTNITNDQSNAERINRWKCAWRMFLEKPFTGFGPGTYQFSYIPFQRENEMTNISVKSPYNIAEGRGGTAHNEYLLVLAESGAPAAFCFLLVILIALITGFNSAYNPDMGITTLAMLLAFLTFIIHSFFNNFLDTDKTAMLFYISIAFFASIKFSGFKKQNV